MMPPAPGRLSATTGWPIWSDKRWASVRPMKSTTPPGVYGNTRRTGFDGYVCAIAVVVMAIAATHARYRSIPGIMHIADVLYRARALVVVDQLTGAGQTRELFQKRDLGHARAGSGESCRGMLYGFDCLRLRGLPQMGAANADSRRGIETARPRCRPSDENAIHQLDVVDRTRKQSYRVEAFGGHLDACTVESAERRLVADDSAKGSGAKHGAAGLRPERGRNHEVRDRRRRAARGAAGRARKIVRVAGLARCRSRELRGDGLAEDDGAGRAHERDACRVGRRPEPRVGRLAHF